MKIEIISLFPSMFTSPLGESILKRAIENKILEINFTNPRDFTFDKHHKVDDTPYGGGGGMVLKAEPFFRALHEVKERSKSTNSHTILLSPAGKTFTQKKAKELSHYEELIFICGHYEGFDARIEENLPDELLSIGDYVLTGGEVPALVIIDAVARMLPAVLGSEDSAKKDSFYEGLLEHPQYTKPREYEGLEVPSVLFSGNHAQIEKWRHEEALKKTFHHRPDLLDKVNLTSTDKNFIEKLSDQEKK